MAGYVFAIGGDTEIIKICAERGVYATRLNSLASRPFEATLADYVSMKPGDNVYFFSERKIYGIGELVAVGPDCKYSNFPGSSTCAAVDYADVRDDLLVDSGEDSVWYRWLCTFKASPYFFEEGIDTDEVLVYKPNTFKMLRAFWNVSFIKLGDEENESLKEILLLRHQQEMRTGQHVWERNDEMHDLIGAHELDRYLIKPESLLCNCVRADRVKHEMALEVSVVYDLCNEGIPNLGRWDYVSHQVVASPFKPINYMDKIDVFAARYLEGTRIPCQYLTIELKKDKAEKSTIDQVLKYVDWVCAEYAYGDYEMIEACIIAADYEDDLSEYYREVVRRYYTLGSHPVRNKQWNRLKLLRYSCIDNRIVYEDVTPQIR